jgi:hypothetical protein
VLTFNVAGGKVVDAYPGESRRRPSTAGHDRMHTIYEGERYSKRSDPVSIPRDKSGSKYNDYARSPGSDRDLLSGSMQSLSLSRTHSSTSSGRRDSVSSNYDRDRRPSIASTLYDDDDENNGMFGFRDQARSRKDPPVLRRDSAEVEGAMRRRDDGMFGWSKESPLDRNGSKRAVDDLRGDRKYSDHHDYDARKRHY